MRIAEILEITPNADGLTATVKYRIIKDGAEEKAVTEPRVSNVDKLSVWKMAQDQVNYLDRVDAQRDAIANLDPAAILGPVDLEPVIKPPTQEELDRTAFIAAIENWSNVKAAFESGASKTITQQDVDAAYEAWKVLYKEEYAPILKNYL